MEHHELKPDGSRVRTELGEGDIGNIPNPTGNPPTLCYSHKPDEVTDVQGLVRQMVAIGIDDPTPTACSPTEAARVGELRQLQVDRLNAIVTGREPLGAPDAFVRDWRNRGGDQIRREYEQALRS